MSAGSTSISQVKRDFWYKIIQRQAEKNMTQIDEKGRYRRIHQGCVIDHQTDREKLRCTRKHKYAKNNRDVPRNSLRDHEKTKGNAQRNITKKNGQGDGE